MAGKGSMTVIQHLEELRRRIIISILAVVVAVLVSFYYATPILNFVVRPSHPYIPKLIFITPAEAFFTQLRLSALAGIVFATPVWLYQVVRFLWPGLERNERRYLLVLLPVCLLLFVGGTAFAYSVILPFSLRFFTSFASENLEPFISLGNYVSYALGLTVPFGVVFELPVLIVLLTLIGIVTPELLARTRKYTIVAVFIVSAVLTPPDVLSQLLMAGPLLVLFEVSVVLSRYAARYRRRRLRGESDADE